MNKPLPVFKVDFKAVPPIAFTEVEIRQKMLIAVNLRKQGYSYSHIAETIDCSPQYTTNLIKRAMREVTEDSANDLVKQELERLNSVFVPAFIEATRLDSKGEPIFNREATDSVLKIMERRAKLLGLDKPTKTELSGSLDVTEKTVQIYIPDNGRGLPKGVLIENGQVINEQIVNNDNEHEEVYLEFDVPKDEDLSDLFVDNFKNNSPREVSAS